MRKRTLVRALGASAIGLIAVLGVCSWLKRPEQAFLPSLTQGLTGGFQKANEIFKARINEKVPIGSSASALIHQLHADDFKQHWALRGKSSNSEIHSANFVRTGFSRKLASRIYWCSENDQLTSVTSSYPGTRL